LRNPLSVVADEHLLGGRFTTRTIALTARFLF